MRHLRRAGVCLGFAVLHSRWSRGHQERSRPSEPTPRHPKVDAYRPARARCRHGAGPVGVCGRGSRIRPRDRSADVGCGPQRAARTIQFSATQPTMSAGEIALTRGKTGPSGAPTSPTCTADTATGPMPLPLTTGVRPHGFLDQRRSSVRQISAGSRALPHPCTARSRTRHAKAPVRPPATSTTGARPA